MTPQHPKPLSDPLIRLDSVSFAYDPSRPVLQGVHLELGAEDRVGLVGSNGSGKTTLLHLIVGLLRPTSGTVRVFGKTRREERDFHEVREKVGLVFQDPEDQLFCPTVAEDVAFGPFNLGWERREVENVVRETLDALGLGGFADRVTHKLSFGEKRLVSLAAVLAMKPQVLLLDEPTAGLDHDVTERLVAVLKALHHPMLVVSHDERFLDRVVSRRLRMGQGRVED